MLFWLSIFVCRFVLSDLFCLYHRRRSVIFLDCFIIVTRCWDLNLSVNRLVDTFRLVDFLQRHSTDNRSPILAARTVTCIAMLCPIITCILIISMYWFRRLLDILLFFLDLLYFFENFVIRNVYSLYACALYSSFVVDIYLFARNFSINI